MDVADARWPSARVDSRILAGCEIEADREVSVRAAYLTSPRHRRAMAVGLRRRPWVRDQRIIDGYARLASRLESPEPISARGILRLRNLLQTTPAAVAVGCPESVVRELGAITFLLDDAVAEQLRYR
jgi:hypothetical protein